MKEKIKNMKPVLEQYVKVVTNELRKYVKVEVGVQDSWHQWVESRDVIKFLLAIHVQQSVVYNSVIYGLRTFINDDVIENVEDGLNGPCYKHKNTALEFYRIAQ